jgi:heptosyltransferase-2
MYARAAATLSPKVRWLILGGPKDQPLAGEVAALMLQAGVSQVQNLAGKTTLRELCAVLRACRVALSNDTGPMHLAAAVGTPVVAPFGSTSPELTGPGLPGDAHSPHVLLTAHAPCAPCFRRQCPVDFRCLRGITPEQVVQAVLTVLARP